MKKILLTTFGISLLSLLTVWGNQIPVEGTWSPKGPRSPVQVPEPPAAFIEGGELSVCFTDALSDLIVTVTGSNNVVVFQDVVSGNSGYTLNIPLAEGSYLLTMEHKAYGYLYGDFIVE